ncbi:MAG: Ig-like domain-containing protein [Kofleriaceae bacterium]
MLVLTDAVGGLVESATYCRVGDEKTPTLVGLPDATTTQVCPDDRTAVQPLTNGYPDGWYVRVVFDELLNPDVEELDEVVDRDGKPTGVYTGTLKNTQPVVLQCQDVSGALVNVPYDGYYSPSGNSVTWPPGPSLVIKPVDPTIVAVESECQVTLKTSIVDKQGVSITQADTQPFKFKIAPIEVISIGPENGELVTPEYGGVDLTFNVEIDSSTLDDTMFTFDPPMDNVGIQHYSSAGIFIYGDMLDSTEYSFTLHEGAVISDKCGKASTLTGASTPRNNRATTFATTPLDLVNIVPFSGMNQRPSNKIRINFNQYMDPTSIDASDFEITPAPEGMLFSPDPNDPTIIRVLGQYQLNTNYKFTMKAGAVIRDAYDTKDLVLAEDRTVDFTTAAQIDNVGQSLATDLGATVVAISGAGGQTITKSDAAADVDVRFSFNQDINGTTYGPDDFTFTKADGSPLGVTPTILATTGATIVVRAPGLPAGSYKFTLKQGAELRDRLSTPNTYTQAADKTFTFNVEVDPPAPFACLGQ